MPFKATCEGAVLYFKNWKTLIKNMGRVLGLGLISLLVIGGVLGVGYYALFSNFPRLCFWGSADHCLGQ
jgi:hypothetical protein